MSYFRDSPKAPEKLSTAAEDGGAAESAAATGQRGQTPAVENDQSKTNFQKIPSAVGGELTPEERKR